MRDALLHPGALPTCFFLVLFQLLDVSDCQAQGIMHVFMSLVDQYIRVWKALFGAPVQSSVIFWSLYDFNFCY